MSIRVLIVDDHQIFREGLRSLIEGENDLEFVGEARDGHEAIQQARDIQPQVVIMDARMPDLNGIDATRQILQQNRGIKVIALSMHIEDRMVKAMLEAGAQAYLPKDCALEELLRAIRVVVEGGSYLSPSIAGGLIEDYRRYLAESGRRSARELTMREREVLQLLAEGNSSKQIAMRLHLSVKTVESHRRNLMSKLGTKSFVDLVKYAIREGLTSLE